MKLCSSLSLHDMLYSNVFIVNDIIYYRIIIPWLCKGIVLNYSFGFNLRKNPLKSDKQKDPLS